VTSATTASERAARKQTRRVRLGKRVGRARSADESTVYMCNGKASAEVSWLLLGLREVGRPESLTGCDVRPRRVGGRVGECLGLSAVRVDLGLSSSLF
jgi:hypothetical protein